MGNCQAVDAAALVIQHPNGKQERMYWSITASEVMKMNPGHYVSLIIPLPTPLDQLDNNPVDDKRTVRFTRVKLLRPSETLILGRAYRLITTQEVMKVLKAKKHKMKRNLTESNEVSLMINQEKQDVSSETERNDEALTSEKQRHRSGSTNSASGRLKLWRPSLEGISES